LTQTNTQPDIVEKQHITYPKTHAHAILT